MAGGDIVVRTTTGSPVTGGWCTVCALPSAVRVPVLHIDDSGVSEIGHTDVCLECEARQ